MTPWTIAHQAPLCMGFPRQEYWSGLPFPFPGDLPDPGIEPMSPALTGGFFTSELSGKPQRRTAASAAAAAAAAKSLQSCLTLCEPIDSNPPGSTIPGILQPRVLELVALYFSGRSPQARDQTQVSSIAGRLFTI